MASSSRKQVREAFCARCLEVDGIESALPYEPGPEALPPLPAVTLRSYLYGQVDAETGPLTDNEWGWEVRVYVPLEGGYQRAQELLDDLVPAVLSVPRRYPDLDGTCQWVRVQDNGEPVAFEVDGRRRYAVKTIQLIAMLQEGGS